MNELFEIDGVCQPMEDAQLIVAIQGDPILGLLGAADEFSSWDDVPGNDSSVEDLKLQVGANEAGDALFFCAPTLPPSSRLYGPGESARSG